MTTDEERAAEKEQWARYLRISEQEPEQISLPDLTTYLAWHYRRTVVPPCSVCGEKLSLQSTGPDEYVWACDGWEDDPESPSERRWKSGRKIADEHYEKSRFTDYRCGGDALVLELIRRTELAEKEKP